MSGLQGLAKRLKTIKQESGRPLRDSLNRSLRDSFNRPLRDSRNFNLEATEEKEAVPLEGTDTVRLFDRI